MCGVLDDLDRHRSTFPESADLQLCRRARRPGFAINKPDEKSRTRATRSVVGLQMRVA